MRAASSGLLGCDILAVKFGERALNRQRSACSALRVVLVCHRIAEQRHQPVAELLRHMAAHLGNRRRGGIEVSADEIAPLLSIKLRGNAGRTHQIAEHDREIAALAGNLCPGDP